MNQRYLWTIVALFLTALGTPLAGHAQTTTEKEATSVSQKSSVNDAVKVGEFKTAAGKLTSDGVITNIHSHNIEGRKAATLFIKDIPVLTFLSSQPVASVDPKVGVIGKTKGQQSYSRIADNSAKLSSVGSLTNARNQKTSLHNDPVHRAGLIAASINQLVLHSEDAEQITVSWKGEGESTANQAQNKNASVSQQPTERYTIKINGQELVEINAKTILAGTTDNLAEDALQATNRLRRLIGNASPITEIADLPERARISLPQMGLQIANNRRFNFRGIASFYGRGFAGKPTATGERFNPEAMTAAHRTLPFGTRVRVTNTRNGRSVVVRINDRGPFIRGRIIDVSTGAARAIGMINSGIAPVKIEVLGR
ncbi:septal ring lytic transglycosylase RlpA family protein [Nodularia spumigena CS-584]|jgi:rare lipoprotein A|uniref:Probable endolytic peptidoglycan transglycosylase RlpA n=1 Tax=Nodularia spumigena UHCC 0060 TaxID=3110300 RepID=A0ABU5UVA8_NODSP|nr:septal ring lytic transglycosylase RlpA family protein [Nodularia spumigena]AHJ29486.1 Rare lipoprotein A precursor [Nodularia spumigena CCY9414]EAW45713.1 Rare lipoprotein A [Nodularia spumigena CCY9414]MDB9383918.1 septal ring lytic transglycosylase RlpA family protein [Nodularia spumigena CS-584]MEA5527254.1 septal ring lytic transglycosylase RlpA family protein [Nodularia spumigena UHCC 0143]MEA5557024.1 septal ring lytic transglycosylase RlpA family protein [Nodularia spumigena CH309]